MLAKLAGDQTQCHRFHCRRNVPKLEKKITIPTSRWPIIKILKFEENEIQTIYKKIYLNICNKHCVKIKRETGCIDFFLKRIRFIFTILVR